MDEEIRCTFCLSWVSGDSIDDGICLECHETTQICEECETRHNDYLMFSCTCDSHSPSYYCDACWQNDVCPCNLGDKIHEWNYKPDPIFFGSGPLYFGVELEYRGDRTDIADAIYDVYCEGGYNSWYLKEDSSVNIELVSHPASMARWEERDMSRFFDLIADIATTDRAGYHIHVSRAAFGSVAHLSRFITFFYLPENFGLILELSRREIGDMRNWANPETDQLVGHKISSGQRRRYEAVNLLPDTVEVRIFSSTLDPGEFMEALEFIDNLFEFTKTEQSLIIRSIDDLKEAICA